MFKISKSSKYTNYIIILTLLLLIILAVYFYFIQIGTSVSVNAPNNKEEASNNTEIDFSLSIEKINLSKVPIIRGVDPTDENIYDEALKNGVAHMVGTALPGQESGNIFIYGHSSDQENNEYGEIFAKLDELKFGDEIIIYYNNSEHKYWVSEKKFIEKDDFSVLEQTSEERVTLMTCWPIGTSDRRIVVIAKRR